MLERAFLRLDTTRNDLITKELIVPALIACGICYFIFIELHEKGLDSLPIMIPTAHGAIVGDVVRHDDGGDLQLRTFLGGKDDLSGHKSALREALLNWQSSYLPSIGDGLNLGASNFHGILKNLHRPEITEFRKHVANYMGVLAQHPRALDMREVRSIRSRQEYRKWKRDQFDEPVAT